MVPPAYLQGRFPWGGPGRPLSANMNPFTQLMSHGPHLVHVAPFHSVSNRPANVYQRFVDDMPHHRSGTGTYLPNPKVPVRDRHSTSTRRGNHNYDRSDNNGDKEGNWNMNSKLQATGRGNNRNQTDKTSSRTERLATSMNSSGVSSNGPTMPSIVMLYPYDHNADYSSPAEQVEFGSLRPTGFLGVHELSQLNEGSQSGLAFEEQRFHGGSAQHSSPDQPSSPHIPRILPSRIDFSSELKAPCFVPWFLHAHLHIFLPSKTLFKDEDTSRHGSGGGGGGGCKEDAGLDGLAFIQGF
ncbi:hypothetical protein RIF29_24094 [Crotalaria pallida]|uniref:Uncharacterized protein n=1 Tax=Crotalaria pallida TaxID=3830 RepID=A0AAN9ELC0_CROPI